MDSILGKEVEDMVTGCRGIVIGKTEWLNGCSRQSKMDKYGKSLKHIGRIGCKLRL